MRRAEALKAKWRQEKLGDVCAFLNRGISPSYLHDGGVCVLNQKCVRDHAVSWEQSRRHDLEAKSVTPERFVRLGDVLVNSTGTGTLGRVAQIREEPAEGLEAETQRLASIYQQKLAALDELKKSLLHRPSAENCRCRHARPRTASIQHHPLPRDTRPGETRIEQVRPAFGDSARACCRPMTVAHSTAHTRADYFR